MPMLGSIFKDIFARAPAAQDPAADSRSLQEIRELTREVRDIARAVDARLRDVHAAIYNVGNAVAATRAIGMLDFELARDPRFGDPLRLLRHAFQVCSQNGEDGMIHEIFRRIGTTNRVFVEVGVGDGRENNTSFLLSQGWRGFWFDGNDWFLKVISNRPDLPEGCLKWLVSFVSKENIASLFGQLGVPSEFDLLSLDIDQNTYYAWEGAKSFRPRVVVVEYNAVIPPDIDWKVHYDQKRNWDATQNFGASLKAYEVLGRRLGYSLVGCDFIGVNAFFVRGDLVAGLFAEPFTSENHYEPPRYALSHRRGHRAALLDRATNEAQEGNEATG
jgi:hypothetical protein